MTTAALELGTAWMNAAASASPQAAKTAAQVKSAGQDFEAMFINELLGPMFDGLSTDGPFGGGPGEQIYRSLMLNEYSKSIASQGGLGLAANVQNELLRMQGLH